MKHLFLLNPFAFKKIKQREALLRRISAECEGLDYTVVLTQSGQDAQARAREAAATGAEVCIYAGGGDGLVHMVAEAIYGFSNAILSVIPIGTGNDFIRSFGQKRDFLSLRHIRHGVTKTIDLIRINDHICANMLNIGFDESVVRKVGELKRFPLMTNSVAYTIGAMLQLVKFPHEQLTITFDDGTTYHDRFLLTYVANGQYCGGGYRAAPRASLDDGLMDVMTVFPISRLKCLKLIGRYKKGTLLDWSKSDAMLTFRQVKSLTMCKGTPFYICLDGETLSFSQLKVDLLPQAMRVRYPAPSDGAI